LTTFFILLERILLTTASLENGERRIEVLLA